MHNPPNDLAWVLGQPFPLLTSVKGASLGFSIQLSPQLPKEAEAKGSSPSRGPMVQSLCYGNVVVLNTF